MRIGNTAAGILLACIAAPAMASEPPAPEAPAAGMWQPHEYQLTFTGIHAAYSCDWLEEKLRLLLKKAGARADIRIQTHCQQPSGPSPGAQAQLHFFALAPATDAGDTPVVWRKVVLHDHFPLALEASDCELVEQFRAELLPFFTTRAIDNRMSCRGGNNDSQGLNLQFEVLVPAGKGGR
jgi:hypothetical protein